MLEQGFAMASPDYIGPLRDEDAPSGERNYAMLTHLAGILSLAGGGIPFLGLIATAVLWRVRHSESPFLDDHGREATNFQISLVVYFIGGIVAGVAFSIVTIGIGAPLVAVAAVLGMIAMVALTLVGCIRGAMAAYRGEFYRYPMCLRFLNEPVST